MCSDSWPAVADECPKSKQRVDPARRAEQHRLTRHGSLEPRPLNRADRN
jgi:hypothetical protein